MRRLHLGVERDWCAFWAQQASPLGRDLAHYQALASEISLLLPDIKGSKVLEIGCGSGILYEPLGFDAAATYRGVDFSLPMLMTFKKQFPDAQLVKADARNYWDTSRYDLIFSHGVIQYFDRHDLRRHLTAAEAMLRDDGVLLHCAIPNKLLRGSYERGGGVVGTPVDRRFGRVVAPLARLFGDNPMGRWWNPDQFHSACRRRGWRAEFFGSLFYPYRFHVRLVKSGTHAILNDL